MDPEWFEEDWPGRFAAYGVNPAEPSETEAGLSEVIVGTGLNTA